MLELFIHAALGKALLFCPMQKINYNKNMNMIEYAKTFIGHEYSWAGTGPKFDCSGFIMEILRSQGLNPPRRMSSQELYNYFSSNRLYSPRNPQEGCLAFYGDSTNAITHVALCISSKQIIEAADSGFVRIRPFIYRKDLVAIILI